MKLYIVNHIDRPCEQYIAERREDGLLYYIHPDIRDDKRYWGMASINPTPIEDFGIVIVEKNGILYGKLTEESIAKYPDGKHRRWQGSDNFSFSL